MKNGKRILSVKIVRQLDDSPDTSYLGEYGRTAKSDYAIDRAHSEDCASLQNLTPEAYDMLTHARAYVAELQSAIQDTDSNEWEDLDETYYLLDSLAEDTAKCDCGGHGVGRNEYEYFNPNWENYKGDTEENIRKYCRQDYERMESLNNQNWYYMGIRAEATVMLANNTAGIAMTQKIRSGGLWGIESDSGKDYLDEVAQDELSALRTELKAIGFSTRAISTAFKNAEECDQ